MLPKQSKLLKIGQRVYWKKKDNQGTVVLVNSSILQIKWDSGKTSHHRHDSMQDISLASEWVRPFAARSSGRALCLEG